MSNPANGQIANVLNETRVFPPSQAFSNQAVIGSLAAYEKIYNKSLEDIEGFWSSQAKENLHWFEPFHTTLEWKNPLAKWFVGGKTNACYNCVDRHVEAGLGEKVALLFEGEPGDTRKITYSELLADVSRFANGLLKLGIETGDRAIIYMPMIPEAVVAMRRFARPSGVHRR